ncbi:hypothetical protein Drose_16675 [Dactylosporangium roseum]|uniref:Uncharacterized protein n=1 Tax=Dactylosporangium roseum TaxID=47989 RepID=A0ABY5ZFH3_9ACTN|nr:hypothetical protein [Dactylosporangium roseum]UWZ39703.1 hypothetical protein Drose_16675 [Dactylosporangium roseum]
MAKHVLAPQQVRVSGANNWMKLYDQDQLVGHASHWSVEWSEHGPGSTLFFWSSATDNAPRLLTDNLNMAAWLLDELESADSPFTTKASELVLATFTVHNETPRRFAVTAAFDGDHQVDVIWDDLSAPVWGNTELESNETHSHSSCYVPATTAQMIVDGVSSAGMALPEDWFGTPSSSAFLAQSEVWLRH